MNLNKPRVASVVYSTFMWLPHPHLTLGKGWAEGPGEDARWNAVSTGKRAPKELTREDIGGVSQDNHRLGDYNLQWLVQNERAEILVQKAKAKLFSSSPQPLSLSWWFFICYLMSRSLRQGNTLGRSPQARRVLPHNLLQTAHVP